MIKDIKKFIINNDLDGYLIPKNDNYFTEYAEINNLAKVSNFSGSAGFAMILKNKNYLFVDGRYILQAKRQSGKNFKICEVPHIWPRNIYEIDKKIIGFDPKLFTHHTLFKYFGKKANLVPLRFNFDCRNNKKIKKIFYLNKSISGEDTKKK